ncbi:protein phosphatase 3 (formerly 2B), regulatory s1ubunit B, alpha isoform, a [Reticulomyxa filosa]|uniref:Protein phosphatase 3 (Formerly 2B), regulatory s1ubunit B, alpha isoform, a n=1 Tax=Reticulomyxa filosa TaxID=46433 RepID=X6MI05_RETFI|nr:protein phosphatase 3 (formerly 2B), regulatory s1ubunit B, alpha isoform, a [Reticulomyxa filosa]|eukprot:ETO13062.1 protein phosphatase 3 (formerly 2B), regulatory s1ubunit B, alpha isoform, a [Reticulomyxa filosa]
MGQSHSGKSPTREESKRESKQEESDSKEEEKTEEVLTNQEMGLLDMIFNEMAMRSPTDKIDYDTFMDFFELPGVLGDRLFKIFDAHGRGVINFEDFILGYKKFAKGNSEMKLRMLFSLFDLGDTGATNRSNKINVINSKCGIIIIITITKYNIIR